MAKEIGRTGGKKDPREKAIAGKAADTDTSREPLDPDRGGKSADKDPAAAEQFAAFGIEGIDTSSMLADIQAKYGGLAGSTGRRGAQAREILEQQGDSAARDFLGTDAYARLQEDPTSISDPAVSAALQAAVGSEWVSLAEGQRGDQGTISATNIDFEALDALIKMKGTPFSYLSDVQSGTALASGAPALPDGMDALEDVDVIPAAPAPPNLPGAPTIGDPTLTQESKRI